MNYMPYAIVAVLLLIAISLIWLNEKLIKLGENHEDRIVYEEAEIKRIKRELDSICSHIGYDSIGDYADATVVRGPLLVEEVSCEDC